MLTFMESMDAPDIAEAAASRDPGSGLRAVEELSC
jgi:hypothetical protein